MSPQTVTTQNWTLASIAITDTYTDFSLGRQGMRCTPETLAFYTYTAGKFITLLESQSMNAPAEVDAPRVRAYLAKLIGEGKASSTVNDHTRAERTLIRFWHAEKYLPEPVIFALPKVEQRRHPVLSVEELSRVLAACNVKEKAIILLLADTGIRRQETCNLNWSDLQMLNGLLRIERGKGKKVRSVVVGATTRRALLAYRRTLPILSPVAYWSGDITATVPVGNFIISPSIICPTGFSVTHQLYDSKGTYISLIDTCAGINFFPVPRK